MTHTPSHRSKWQRAAFVLLLGSMVQTAFASVINVSAQDNLNDALARAKPAIRSSLPPVHTRPNSISTNRLPLKVRPIAPPRLSATGAGVPLPFMRLT